MPYPKRRRFRAPATFAIAGFVGALLVPFGVLAATSAVAAEGECPPGYLPGPNTPGANEIWTDDNVAVYAGGDFLADGEAAESEGVLVVMGDATFAKQSGGPFNVGWVGVGSQAAPTPGSVMLAVGGGLTVGTATVLDVGSGARDAGDVLLGGDVQVGAVTDPAYPSPQYELNNGSLEAGMGPAAVSEWADFGSGLATNSATWVAMPGTAAVSISGAQATFTGDGTSGTQVFTITAAQLSTITEVYFVNVADDAPVVINVIGAEDVTFSPTYFADDGVRADDPASPLFGLVAQRTLWNFADTTSVTFGGSSQFLGSVLAPNADFDITASMNGRVYAGGDIHMHGVGNELHNYPWIGPAYSCFAASDTTVTGSADLTKVLSTEGVAAPDRAFFGWLRCVGENVDGTFYREGVIRAGQTLPGRDLPIGAECTLFEDTEREVDGQEPLPPGFMWADPVWSINGEIVDSPVFIVPGPDEPRVEVMVTNTLLGRFSIEKAVTGPDGGFTGDRAFEISSSCDAGAYDDDGEPLGAGSGSATYAIAAGDTEMSAWFPVGTTCEISEETPLAESGDFELSDAFQWQQPVIAPGTFSIGDGDVSPIDVTVTNTFARVMGAFTIEKVVTGVGAPDATFTGTWSCELPGGAVVADGVWSLAAGARSEAIAAPVGAECDVDETAPAGTDAGTWAAPVITGAPLTVTAASAEQPAGIVVTNAFTASSGGGADGGAKVGGEGALPATGTTVPWSAVGLGAAFLAAGAVVLGLRLVRRRLPERR